MKPLFKYIVTVMIFGVLPMASSAMSLTELRVSGPCDMELVCCPDSAGMMSLTEGTDAECGLDIRRVGDTVYLDVDPSASRRVALKMYADDALRVVMGSKRCHIVVNGFRLDGILSVSASSSASLTLSNLSAKIINVSLTGSGFVNFNDYISASVINISQLGSGTIDATDIATSTLSVTQRGSGKLAVTGSAKKCEVVGLGTGTVNVSRLVSAEMELKSYHGCEIFYPAGVRAVLEGNTEKIKSIKPYQPL